MEIIKFGNASLFPSTKSVSSPKICHMKFHLLVIFSVLFLFSTLSSGQENTPMRVIKGTAIPASIGINNIYIDADNKKYVAGDGQIYQLFSADNATPLNTPTDQWHLLLQSGGNALRNFPIKSIQTMLGDTTSEAVTVNASFFDPENKTLWIGTSEKGLFELLISDDRASFVRQYNTENSKLKSNKINALLVDKYNRVWAGSNAGVLMREKEDGEFKLYEKRDKIVDITALGPDVWILGEGILWMANDRNRWIPGDVDSRYYQGKVRDIQYDSEGRLWVASDIITRYDVVKNKVERFDASNGFTSKNVSVIRVDQEDALWVGTKDQGVFLIEPAAKMTVSAEVTTPLSCDGKAAAGVKAIVIGGTAPFSYTWNNSKITGAEGNGLGAGLYEVTITDAAGQTRKASANVAAPNIRATTTLLQPTARKDTDDGSASIQAMGGTEPYQYEWDNGETDATAVKLTPGKHTIKITDANNCHGLATIEVTSAPPLEVAATPEPEEAPPVSEPVVTPTPAPEVVPLTPLEVKVSYQAMLDCPGDQTTVTTKITGGAAPYAYAWSAPERSKATATLAAGDYSLTVTDDQGNTNTQNFSIKAPAPLVATATMNELATDESIRNGKATVKVTGGTGSYLILWDNGENGAQASKLKFGNHTVSVSDAKGCKTTTSVNIKKRIIAALDVKKLQTGQTIQIEQLFFDADSTNMKSTSIPVMNEMYDFLRAYPQITVEIGGHTNDIPAHDYCDALSTARAKSVVDYLVNKGIPVSQLTFKGYGKRKPLVSNRSAAGRRKNQRVEIKVLKVK